MKLQSIIDRLSSKFADEESGLLAKYLIQDIEPEDRYNDSIMNDAIERLLMNEPLQYITGKAYFLKYIFHVSPAVLIPRPETEELVEWVKEIVKEHNIHSLLDVGTGSGCIGIALKDATNITVTSIDISEDALDIAKQNAEKYNCSIEFLQLDFTNDEDRAKLTRCDLIVSNPPYITTAEKKEMLENVLNYEPLSALFAMGEDPFIFYKLLADYGKRDKSMVMCELNEYYADHIVSFFKNSGYPSIEIKKDMQGKSRMLLAKW